MSSTTKPKARIIVAKEAANPGGSASAEPAAEKIAERF
jgi:hypothetical protein